MKNIKSYIAAGLGFLTIIILFLGLFSRGWVISDSDETNSMEWSGLRSIKAKEKSSGFTVEFDWADTPPSSVDRDDWDDANSAGLTTYILLWFALFMTIAAMVLTLISSLGKISATSGMISFFSSGLIITLGVILYVIIFPNFDSSQSWNWAFYLVIFGGLFEISSGSILLLEKLKGSKDGSEEQINNSSEVEDINSSPTVDDEVIERLPVNTDEKEVVPEVQNSENLSSQKKPETPHSNQNNQTEMKLAKELASKELIQPAQNYPPPPQPNHKTCLSCGQFVDMRFQLCPYCNKSTTGRKEEEQEPLSY